MHKPGYFPAGDAGQASGAPKAPSSSKGQRCWTMKDIPVLAMVYLRFSVPVASCAVASKETPVEVPRGTVPHRSSLPPHGPSVCEYLHCITLLQFLPSLRAPPPSSVRPAQRPRLRSASSPVPSASPTFLPFSPLLHFPVPDIISTRTNPQRKTPSSGKRFSFDSRYRLAR